MPKFLLLLGPSGCGKSTIIRKLRDMDTRYTYISPYITRPLREGEADKVSISNQEMDDMNARGELLVINEIYGIRYATPRTLITEAFACRQFPVLDWPVDRLSIMSDAFGYDRLFVVYVAPPSLKELHRRLQLDGRDADGVRFEAGRQEWFQYEAGEFDDVINLRVTSEANRIEELASTIHQSYLLACGMC
jgi:guanylate kinase